MNLDELLQTPWPHPSPAPEIDLLASFELPFDGAIAAARPCYSPRGVITPPPVDPLQAEDDDTRQSRTERRDRLARDLYQAGHHTVFQHAHFTFSLANVSRQFVWSYLHQHPFYNSEQVSQRFVRVKGPNALIPDLPPAAAERYRATLERLYEAYAELRTALKPAVREAYFQRFPARRKRAEAYKGAIGKRSQEIARYVLPIGTHTYLHHTISGVTLLRYVRFANHPDVPDETRYIVAQMVRRVLEQAPAYREILEPPLATDAHPVHTFADTAPAPPDAEMPTGRPYAALLDYTREIDTILCGALREITGQTWSPEDTAQLLDPAWNRLLGESLNLTYHDKLSRALLHIHYTFRKQLSHTADSQDQRHRMTPGSRPLLTAHLGDTPDIIYPELIRAHPQLQARYEQIMDDLWLDLRELRRLGAPAEAVQYLLPNAVAVRFTESGDLLALRHKHLMRLCYNAQEEIWRASLMEAQAIAHVHPHMGQWLVPPCTARDRASTRPICPEGSRFCGVAVWKLAPSDYKRLI